MFSSSLLYIISKFSFISHTALEVVAKHPARFFLSSWNGLDRTRERLWEKPRGPDELRINVTSAFWLYGQ